MARWTCYFHETGLFKHEDLAYAFISDHKLQGALIQPVSIHAEFDVLTNQEAYDRQRKVHRD